MHQLARLHPPRRLWAAWWVLCVWLLAALAPVVSPAWAAGAPDGPARQEVCTSSGAQWLTLAPDAASAEGPTEPARAMGGVHCPWCLQPADSGLALPPPDAASLPVPPRSSVCPIWQTAVIPTPSFLGATPRGPPARA